MEKLFNNLSTQRNENLVDKSYRDLKISNGTKIAVGWDNGYSDYTIYFPELELGDEAREKGVYDQVIRISEIKDVARKVFDYAVSLAETETGIYDIFKKVEEFSRDLN